MIGAPYCQKPDLLLKKPKIDMPLGAIDCHAHICGPEIRFPYSEKRIYTPHDALLPEYLKMLSFLGVDRAVLVQPSIYDVDNRALLDALKTDSTNLRGVAVVKESITEREIEELHYAGVRGIRCNIVDLAEAKGILPLPSLKKMAHKIAPFGWHIELLMHANEFPNIGQSFKDFPVEIVLGHFGYQPCGMDINTAGFQGLLSLMREGRAWVKFTGPYRISSSANFPYSDVNEFAHAIVMNSPRQIVWGTDWPHVMVKNAMPNDADLCDLLQDWVEDSALLKAILVKNPERLYDFH